MHDLLLTVFNMSVTASVVILFVLAVRLLLRRSPRMFSYVLWIVVLFRLVLFPCAIAGALALLGFHDVVIPALMMYAMPCGMNTIIVPYLKIVFYFVACIYFNIFK